MRLSRWKGLFALVLLGALFWAWQQRPFRVTGQSMEPVLQEGDWVFIEQKEVYQKGEVVVFYETDTQKNAIKRVVGVPGESVLILDAELFIDGQAWELSPSSVYEQIPCFSATGPNALEAFHAFRAFRTDGHLTKEGFIPGEHPVHGLGLEVDYSLLEKNDELRLQVREGENIFQLFVSAMSNEIVLSREAPGESECMATAAFDGARSGTLFLSLQGARIHAFFNQSQILQEGLLQSPRFEKSQRKPFVDIPIDFSSTGAVQLRVSGSPEIKAIRVGRAITRRNDGQHGCGEVYYLGEGEYFLLGDNPSESRDSRQYGSVSVDDIAGSLKWQVFEDERDPWGWYFE